MAERNPSLRALVGAPVSLQVGDALLQVQPMGWYQASLAVEHIVPVLAALPDLAALGTSKAEKTAAWMSALIASRDELAAFCAAASGFDIGEIRELPPAAFAELAIGLVEINADFFVRSLPALIERATGRFAAMKAQLDAMLPPASAAAPAQSPGSTTSSSA